MTNSSTNINNLNTGEGMQVGEFYDELRRIEELVSNLLKIDETQSSLDNAIDLLVDKDVLFFDIDGTLANSKYQIDYEMCKLLSQLSKHKKIVLITSSGQDTVEKNVISILRRNGEANMENIMVSPLTGTEIWENEGEKYVYKESLKKAEISTADQAKITEALDKAVIDFKTKYSNVEIDNGKLPYNPGELVEIRGHETSKQITLSYLGQSVPKEYMEMKVNWDPEKNKRDKLIKMINDNLGNLAYEFEIRSGGASSIDITMKGIDKEAGFKNVLEYLGDGFSSNDLSNAAAVGDSFGYKGNDYPMLRGGLQSVSVSNPEQSKKLIRGLLEKIT